MIITIHYIIKYDNIPTRGDFLVLHKTFYNEKLSSPKNKLENKHRLIRIILYIYTRFYSILLCLIFD